MHMAIPRIGIGLDCSVTPLRHGGLCLVQTTDFFYPIVDDPYMMGKIACANVLSDLYAMGVIDCDNMLMLLAVSTKMTEKERDVVIPLIMRGFKVKKVLKKFHIYILKIFFNLSRIQLWKRALQSLEDKVSSIHGAPLEVSDCVMNFPINFSSFHSNRSRLNYLQSKRLHRPR